MTPRSLWTILIKVFGLFVLAESLTLFPSLVNMAHSVSTFSGEVDYTAYSSVIIGIGIYVATVWLTLFKSDLIIDKLSLDQHFKEEKLDINLKASTVIQIAIILFGGLMVLDSLPSFFRHAFEVYQQKMVFRQSPTFEWLLYHFVVIVFGYLLITNSGRLTNWIGEKEKK